MRTIEAKRVKNESKQMEIFEKKFNFINSDSYQLPAADIFYSKETQPYEPLQIIKRILNFVKNKLNDFKIEEWSEHTRKRNQAQQIVFHLKNDIKAEFVTQAFAKMFECLSTFDLIPENCGSKLTSVHLCEAPGAFITSINHFLKLHRPNVTEFQYRATTLNPYYEGNSLSNTILDDRFILHTLPQWFFGDTYSGNILDINNIRTTIEYCKNTLGEINLVTGDGSIDCISDPENQESVVSQLHTAEFITALALLANNGSLLLKIFTFYELHTMSMLYVLNCCFKNVHLFKPACSKSGNSEVYVIAIGFKKEVMTQAHIEVLLANFKTSENSMLPLDSLPQDFLTQVCNAARFFMNQQVSTIENNIRTFRRYDKQDYHRMKILKEETLQHYIKLYGMKPIPQHSKLLQGVKCNNNLNLNIRVHSGSHSERVSFNNLSKSDQLHILYDRLKYFYDTIESHMFTKEDERSAELHINQNVKDFVKLIQGSAIRKVMSSKFVLVTIMKYFMELRSFMEDLSTEQDENVQKYSLNGNTLSIDVLYLRSGINYDAYEKEVVKLIFSQIIEQKCDSFIINDLLLLTQFLVGAVLFLGSYVYKEITFQMSSHSIKFSSLREDGIANANYLANILSQNVSTSATILGICDTRFLFTFNVELFYKSIIDYNNHLCLKYCSCYLNKISL